MKVVLMILTPIVIFNIVANEEYYEMDVLYNSQYGAHLDPIIH